MLAHAGVCIIQALVESGPANVRHDGAFSLWSAFVYEVFEGPEGAEAQLGAGRAQEARETCGDALFEEWGPQGRVLVDEIADGRESGMGDASVLVFLCKYNEERSA